MFKFKITAPLYRYYDGIDILKSPEGTIVECVSGGDDNCNAGDIMVRTNNNERPFMNLIGYTKYGTAKGDRGSYWGNALGSYKFRVLVGKTIDDYPE